MVTAINQTDWIRSVTMSTHTHTHMHILFLFFSFFQLQAYSIKTNIYRNRWHGTLERSIQTFLFVDSFSVVNKKKLSSKFCEFYLISDFISHFTGSFQDACC